MKSLHKMETHPPSPFYEVPIYSFLSIFGPKKEMILKGVEGCLKGVAGCLKGVAGCLKGV